MNKHAILCVGLVVITVFGMVYGLTDCLRPANAAPQPVDICQEYCEVTGHDSGRGTIVDAVAGQGMCVCADGYQSPFLFKN